MRSKKKANPIKQISFKADMDWDEMVGAMFARMDRLADRGAQKKSKRKTKQTSDGKPEAWE